MTRKYGNKKVTCHGFTFDSMKEAGRYGELLLMVKAGLIGDLQRQVPIHLVDGVTLPGATRKRPAIRLIVDFTYMDLKANHMVYEDSKGFETQESKTKRHLALALRGINVVTT